MEKKPSLPFATLVRYCSLGAIALAQQRIKGKSKIPPNCLRQLLLSAVPLDDIGQ